MKKDKNRSAKKGAGIMKKRILSIGLIFAMMMAILTGCNSDKTNSENHSQNETKVAENNNEKYRIGFSMWEFGNTYFANVRDGAQEKADELGYELIVTDPNNDVAQQVADIENFISMDVDAIIVCAIDPNAVDSALVEAQEKGIKIIAQSIEIKNCDVFVATDEYEIGYTVGAGAGQWIAEKYGEDAVVQCALLCMDANTSTVERGNGMNDGILEYAPNAEIVARQDANTAALGQSVGDSLLQAYPDLQVMVCMNDATALGALSAVQAAGKDNEDFYIVGLDNTDEARAAIAQNSALRATLDNIPYENGGIDIELCQKLFQGEDVEWRYKIPAVLVTYDDVNE